MTKKIKDFQPKIDVSSKIHEKSLETLAECKKDLADILVLIDKLKRIDPKKVLKAIAKLEPKEKEILLSFARQGQICLKFQEIAKKQPKYIS